MNNIANQMYEMAQQAAKEKSEQEMNAAKEEFQCVLQSIECCAKFGRFDGVFNDLSSGCKQLLELHGFDLSMISSYNGQIVSWRKRSANKNDSGITAFAGCE